MAVSLSPLWNEVAIMLDLHLSAAADMELYTDASGSHGSGAYYCVAWFSGDCQNALRRHYITDN